MRLDPDRELSSATVEAILDLLGGAPLPPDGGLANDPVLRVAMGVADEAARLACARAVLASPSALARLVRLEADLGRPLEVRPSPGELADLGRLSAFAGPFSERDAEAAFPHAFAGGKRLGTLESAGWLVRDARGELILGTEGFVVPDDAGEDAGWRERFVLHHAEAARRIERVLAEGRWTDGSSELRRRLPNLRAAWRIAGETGMFPIVEAMARALAPELMETAMWEAFADLAAAGYAAAEALGNLPLRSFLLSYEGAAAALRGERDLARRLWTERLRLARETGRTAAEADSLLDLAGLAHGDGDEDAALALLDEAEPAVAAAGRPDLVATLVSNRALVCLALDRPDEAAALASNSLAILEGTEGARVGVFVRLVAARTLLRSGRSSTALAALADVLERCVEAGRTRDAATTLMGLAEALESCGGVALAGRCLRTAVAVRRVYGARRLEEAERELAIFESRHPRERGTPEDDWTVEAMAILAVLRADRNQEALIAV